MEKEIRQPKPIRVRLAGKVGLIRAKFHMELLMLSALEELRINRLDHLDGLVDASVEFLKGCLVVLHRHGVGAGESGDGVLGCVADALDLEAQRPHVFVQAGIDELGEGDILLFGVLFGLFEDVGEGFQALEVGGDGVGVERGGHFALAEVKEVVLALESLLRLSLTK